MRRILESTQDGWNADMIYLDFAKAFDKVDHGILLHKLQNHGIMGSLGRWLHSFLTGRTQQVSVQGKLSEPSRVKSGVPQGSVLGPLLFIIHVEDIDEKLKYTEASSFADDTRLKRQITCPEDAANTQKDLNEIQIWAASNNMALNGEKFELVR
ncbi:uncharacterized protein LOC143020541 [Oratosquilla oratoria]|uniref:uncharacterized protein LOC143020541 n=1 Tax=Oratosquilla oratoria TaxID=337810 RepID=UPI003F75C9E4